MSVCWGRERDDVTDPPLDVWEALCSPEVRAYARELAGVLAGQAPVFPVPRDVVHVAVPASVRSPQERMEFAAYIADAARRWPKGVAA